MNACVGWEKPLRDQGACGPSWAPRARVVGSCWEVHSPLPRHTPL